MKTCPRCKVTKPLNAFAKRSDRPSGVQSKCRECNSIMGKSRRVADPAAARKRVRDWQKANPDKHRDNCRRQLLRGKYGITPADYDAMVVAQGGRCAICLACRADTRGRRFYIDHDHSTGKVRGLLCHYCNVGIGSLKDSITVVQDAAAYLQRHGG